MVGLVTTDDDDTDDEHTANIEFVYLDVPVDVVQGKEEEVVFLVGVVVHFVFFSFLGILLKRDKII